MSSAAKPANLSAATPRLVLIMGVLAVSTSAVFIRLAQENAPSLVVAALRLVFSSLILSPWAWLKYRQEMLALPRRAVVMLAFSGLFLALHFASWFISLEYTSVASSIVLVTTTPLWVAVASPLVLKEKVSRAILVGLAFALIGSVITAASESCQLNAGQFDCNFNAVFSGSNVMLGNFLALLGAWLAAAYLIVGRKMRSRVSIMVYIYVVYSFGALFLLAATWIMNTPLTGYPVRFYGIALLLAIIPQIIGHSSYNWALGYLPATFVSISLLGEPIGTILLAYFILRESPSWLEVCGGLLILVGIYLASRNGKKASQKAATGTSQT